VKSDEVMKACQSGFGNYKNALDDANNLLAECYGTIGKLRKDLDRCLHLADCINSDDALKQLEKIRDIASEWEEE
jgi:hypothetical protein